MRTATLVVILTASLTNATAAQQGLPQFVIPDCLGVNIHFTSGQEEQIKKIAAAGFRFIRMDFHWSAVEKLKGQYDFSAYDELVADLDRHGIRPLFILDYGNVLYDDGLAPHTDEGRRAFAAFAKAGAARFRGKGVLWEIWNEPNLTKFWQPDANVENYVRLVETTSKALREADPECVILAPALAGWDFAWLEQAFKLGLLEHIDVVSLHAYGASRPEDAALYYSTVKSLIAEHAPYGKEVPIVSGEWGYSAVKGFTVERQAQYLVRSFLTNMMNDARLSIWYDWRDDGPDREETEHNFGVVYEDLSEKPSYAAVRTLTRELEGYCFAARMSVGSENDYVALFTRNGAHRLAVWTIGEPHDATIPIDVPKVEIVSMTGERREVEVSNGKLALKLTGAVTYVIPLEPSRLLSIESGLSVSAGTYRTEGGRLAVKVEMQAMGLMTGGGVMRATAPGMQECAVDLGGLSREGGRLRAQCSGDYTWDGRPGAKVTVTLQLEGLAQPIVRIVELDTASCPTIEVLPPSDLDLLVAVNRPAVGAEGHYSGTLEIGNAEGLVLEQSSREFAMEPGKNTAMVRFPLRQAPAAIFSFAARIAEENGSETLRAPSRRFSVIETFGGGRLGGEVTGYRLELDGDGEVPAEAKLTYAEAPEGGPDGTCARLDYRFGEGWRFVRVSPRPMIPIQDRPSCAVMWIYGDGKDGVARLRVTDSEQQTFQPDYGRLNFTGWRAMKASLTGEAAGHWGGPNDGLMRYPISWNTLFLLDSPGGRKTEGVVYLGPMMLCYD